jgi:hypothetical protein
VSKNATVSETFVYPSPKVAQISWDPETGAITPDTQLPAWVHTSKLVAKPDQLIKRRGKSGLLLLNKDWEQAKEWIVARAGKEVQVSYSTLFWRFGVSYTLFVRSTSMECNWCIARHAFITCTRGTQSFGMILVEK